MTWIERLVEALNWICILIYFAVVLYAISKIFQFMG
ncbi:hypothetical protein LCGC14_1424280 [marine sediment metagenome]|uniref:Uncharacterized protein n=1 Tax=marine sediment metagenome TaxID=412755 RepID=A0A0F9M5X2_9ZZZZ